MFKELVTPETLEAIDEMMVPFKGKHGAKMYMPKKPCKWGYKLWCRAGISGYMYDFEVLGGSSTKSPPENLHVPYQLGESDYVIIRL